MNIKLLLALWSICFLAACSSQDDQANLLSIPVKGMKPVSMEELQHYKEQLKDHQSIISLSSGLFDLMRRKYSNTQNSALIVERQDNDKLKQHNISFIFDGVPDDDSISGYRYDILLQQKNGTFEIESIKESWRCWPGRGHRHFSTEPCK